MTAGPESVAPERDDDEEVIVVETEGGDDGEERVLMLFVGDYFPMRSGH